TDRWMTASTSSRHKPAFDGFLAAACLAPASELARGTMASSYRRRYLLALFVTVRNCTLNAEIKLVLAAGIGTGGAWSRAQGGYNTPQIQGPQKKQGETEFRDKLDGVRVTSFICVATRVATIS